jgi:hypothetical protein
VAIFVCPAAVEEDSLSGPKIVLPILDPTLPALENAGVKDRGVVNTAEK